MKERFSRVAFLTKPGHKTAVEHLRDALTNADSVGVPDLETLRGLVDAVKEANKC